MHTVIDLTIIGLFSLIWLGIVAFLRLKRGTSFIYLSFFTIFFVYLFNVLDYTLFQFQSLLLLQYVMPNLMLRGLADGDSLNLVPLLALRAEDVGTSLLNILLFLPFGFGLPFITALRMKRTVVAGMLLSIGIELLQWATGRMAGMTFRIADINDVLFNTIGAAIGYLLFIGFILVCRRMVRTWITPVHPIVRYVTGRPQLDTD